LGLLIIAGFGALAVGIARRTVHATPRATAPAAAGAAERAFAAPPINLPKGAHVAGLSTGTNRLVVDVALPDGSEELLFIDLATGRRLGTVPLHTAR
ncbi:MAG TPA: hypothetical protein VME41_08515, partial [Stellaceae bacterium]|nr:hypothetical protein [Stellaceae bacterium]